MIAEGSIGIRHSAQYLRDEILGRITDPALASELHLIAQQFDIIAEDYDRVVDNLVLDNVELIDFFKCAFPYLDEEASKLANVRLTDRVSGLRVSSLIKRADRDMLAFIAVHASIERAKVEGHDWAVMLNRRAWQFLQNYLERRRYRAVG